MKLRIPLKVSSTLTKKSSRQVAEHYRGTPRCAQQVDSNPALGVGGVIHKGALRVKTCPLQRAQPQRLCNTMTVLLPLWGNNKTESPTVLKKVRVRIAMVIEPHHSWARLQRRWSVAWS